MLTAIGKLREYRRNAGMSRAQLEAIKLAKFRRLVDHANRHSPYYTQIIRERGIAIENSSPHDFPELTKSLLMENFDRIVTDRRVTRSALSDFLKGSTDPDDLFLNEYKVLHTSGSSGGVGYLVYSQSDWARGIAQAFRPECAPPPKARGFRRYRVAYFGAVRGHYAGVSMVRAAQRGILGLFVRVGMYEVNDPLPEVVAQLNAFQPDLLTGYTTALKVLAASQREGVLRIAPLGIRAGGEGMTPADKALLESAFGCEARSSYSCTEHLWMGITASGGSTMVLYDDDLIYEIRDDHCLVTNLFNRTVPLIRYRMGDALRPSSATTSPSPYLEIDNLVGRSELVPAFTNQDGVSDFLSPFTILMSIHVEGVRGYQLQILSSMRFRFLIWLDAASGPGERTAAVSEIERTLRAILAQKRMSNVGFDVIVTDTPPINPRTGKLQAIVDARPNDMAVRETTPPLPSQGSART